MLKKYPFFKMLLKLHRKKIAICSLVLFLQAVILLVLPLPLRYALDQFVKQQSTESAILLLSKTTLLVLVLGLMSSVLEYFEEILNAKLMNSFVTAGRKILFQKTITREQNFINSWKKIEISGRIVGDVQNLEVLLVSGNVVALRSLPSLIFVVAAMFYIKFSFALIILVMLPIFYLIVTFLTKKIKMWEKHLRIHQITYEQNLLQTLSSLSLVKSLNGEEIALNSIQDEQARLNSATEKSRHFVGLFNSSFSFSRHFMRALVVFFGGIAVLKGFISIGTLFVFVTYLESLNKPIAEISNFLSRYGKAANSLERMEEYYALMNENGETSGEEQVPESWSGLKFKNVSLSYAKNVDIFSSLNLELKKQETIALIGASGSGKSSFIRLLNRLQKTSSGSISMDTTPVNDFNLKSLRKNICVVSQDPFFIAASVKDNLLMALDYEPTTAQIDEALELVNAKSFVEDMPQKMETLIGEAGVQISGGQGKRLSLARAFLRKDQAKIFVFDEPTSGLDPISATFVMNSIKKLGDEQKLILYSTHRLEEFSIADKILFFSSGNNPVLSSHNELLANNNAYQQMLLEFEREGV